MKLITRRRARECVLQALYSWQLSQNNLQDIEDYIISEHNIEDFNISYFHELYVGIVNCIEELNQLMIPYISRNLRNVGYVEHAVLLIALFELTKRYDLPYKVVINEAIELAKIFGTDKSYKFINGVLDKIANKMNFIR